jgi:FtsP/CotA-like multicopper oxidase with cupredoxin domain
MQPDRREFLKGGIAAGITGLVGAGLAQADDLDPRVVAEMHKRLKFLSPPDGIAADPLWGLPQLSPSVLPFTEELFIPPIIQPEIDMSGDDYLRLRNDKKAWLEKFGADFDELAKEYRKRNMDIGELPVPEAHQRFWEYLPRKFYILVEKEFQWRFHKDYRDKLDHRDKSWSWGFEAKAKFRNGKVECRCVTPGPIFHARYGEPILVRRINDLPDVGHTDGNARIKFGLPSTSCHLHNAHTASESDGFPNDWINPRQYWDHHYANFPSGHDDREKLTTLWYHDHRMDYTAANVYAGLDGFYLLFDELVNSDFQPKEPEELQDVGDETKGWRLPSGDYDIPLMLHDLAFAYDEKGIPQLAFDGFNTDGVIGDSYTVNRRIRPKFEVEPRKYRFRIIDGGPSRFYELFLCPEKVDADPVPFVVITGDGNFQPSPLLTERVYLGVAQRVDVIIDFSRMKPGEHLYLVNLLTQVNGKGPNGRLVVRPTNPAEHDGFLAANSIMRFDIIKPKGPDRSRIKLTFRDLPPVDLTEVRRERVWEFDSDGGLWTVNHKIYDPNRVDAGIEQDSAEIWTFRNSGTGWHHPIHSHFTEHIILEINGVPQYQARVQTGPVPRREEFQKSLITADTFKEPLSRHLKDQSFRKQFKAAMPSARARRAAAPLDLKVDQVFTDQDVKQTVWQVQDSINQVFFDWVADFEAAAIFIKKFLNVDLIIPKDDRFMGGPRRDIVLLLPGSEVKVYMRWKDFMGKYVMHCHNVVHEDHAMMVRWDIMPPGLGFDRPQSEEAVRARDSNRPHVEPHPGQATSQEEDARKARPK